MIFFSVSAPQTYALKRAVFPDSTVLQPPPINTYPNISGNVNSTTSTIPEYDPVPENQEEAPLLSPEQEVTKTSSTHFSMFLWPLLISLLIGIFFIYRKIASNKNTI